MTHTSAQPDSRPTLIVLPDNLLTRIFEHLPRRDLTAVSRLSRHLHALADAVLYRTLDFMSPELHLTFSESLQRRPRRGSAVYELKIAYPADRLEGLLMQQDVSSDDRAPRSQNCDVAQPRNGDSRRQNGHTPSLTNSFNELSPSTSVSAIRRRRISLDNEALSATLGRMSNLETLDLAVSESLLHPIGKLFGSPFDFSCLRTCHLFYQTLGNAYWDLRTHITVFTHPTLETLVIRRARLDERGFDLMEKPEQTALRTLHLLECDISDDALCDVLAFPKALRELVLTQLPEPDPPLEETTDNAHDYVLAMGPAAHSLRTVVMDFPSLNGRRGALRMREFEELKTLRLSWDYQLLGTRRGRKPRLQSVGLPPNLETLEFFCPVGSEEEVTELLVYMIKGIAATARKLTRLVVVDPEDHEGGSGIPEDVVRAVEGQKQLRLDVAGRFETQEAG